MTSKPLEVRVPITELPTLVEKKSKQTYLNNKPEQMSLPILMTYLMLMEVTCSMDRGSMPSFGVKLNSFTFPTFGS